MREGKAKVLSPAELERLFKIASTERHAERNQAILALSFGLGLRAGEIAGLDLEDMLIQGKLREVLYIRPEISKVKKARELPLSNPRVVRAIMAYLPVRKASSGPLFLSNKHSRMDGNVMQQVLRALYDKAGLHEAKSHSGRRTFATRLIQKATDIKTVQTLMGHASVAMTGRYAESDPERMREAAGKAL